MKSIPALAVRCALLAGVALSLSGCIAVAATGAVIGATGAVVGAVIPDGDKKD